MTPVRAASEAIKAAIERSSGPLPPPFVVHFLLDHWRRYLAFTYRDNGDPSPPWQEAIKSTDLLLWSVAPKNSREDKRALIAELDALVTTMRIGMMIANADAVEQAEFLTQLSDWHLELISRSPPSEEAGHPNRSPLDPNDTIQLEFLDPRYRELMDLLDDGSVEQIDIER